MLPQTPDIIPTTLNQVSENEYYSWFILLVPRSDLQPESLCLFRYGQCVFTDDGETRTFCFRDTRDVVFKPVPGNFLRVKYIRIFALLPFFCVSFVS